LVQRYVRTGRLRIVFANFPILGRDSERAARFAIAAGEQDRMWPFIDLFMNNQQQEGSGYVTDAFLEKLASQVPGLDGERALASLDSDEVRDRLADVKQLASSNNIRATPMFLLGKTGETPTLLRASSSNTDAFGEAIEALLNHR
jgi:protein-disulfide isomerase